MAGFKKKLRLGSPRYTRLFAAYGIDLGPKLQAQKWQKEDLRLGEHSIDAAKL